MFKVNNKDTRTTSLTSVSIVIPFGYESVYNSSIIVLAYESFTVTETKTKQKVIEVLKVSDRFLKLSEIKFNTSKYEISGTGGL